MVAAARQPEPVALQWRPYQKQCIDDRKRVQADFWARQTGKDFTTAFKTNLRGLEGGADWIITSLTQRQSDLNHEKVATHARAMSHVMCPEAEEDFPAKIGDKTFIFTKRVVTLPTGVKIISLPGRDPDTLAGYTANVIITEYALFPGGGHKHWKVIAPIALTNGLSIYIITTPRTKDTKAYEIRQNKRGRYSVRTVDVYRAVNDGLVLRDEDGEPCSIEVFKEIYGDPVGWQTEYLVKECDDLDALISWSEIEAAHEPYDCVMLDLSDDKGYSPTKENIFARRLGPLPGRLTCGWDVARRRHLSSFWINEEVAGRQWLRALVLFRRCSFAFQRDGVIEQAMDTLPNLVGCGDATGLGMESNERLTNKYGIRWRGVTFTSQSKISLASTLQTTYQDRGQAFPASAEAVAYDLHSLQKEVRGDRVMIHEMQNALEPDSHCDMAFSNALALEAAKLSFAEPFISVL